jgi:hypothetical protein
MARYHRLDGWRGYSIPEYAIAGASCTGDWSDSPAPTDRVLAELADFRKILRKHHIRSRIKWGQSSNCFCAKVWIVVHSKDFARGRKLADAYLASTKSTTHYIHDAA